MGRKPTPIMQRFMTKVNIRDRDECWDWAGEISPFGYGRFSVTARRRKQAHRLSYELHCGPIPEGLSVCHTCDNRRCVNPSHLFLGTDADNVADKVAKTRQAQGIQIRQAKLTETEAMAIRVTKGISQRALARRYGISPTQVKDIQLGRYWRHIVDGEATC